MLLSLRTLEIKSDVRRLFVHDNRMLAERAFYCLCEQRAMKARVSGTPAGRDAVDKAKGKEEVI